MPVTIDCFKAYDIRGQIPAQLNEDIAYRIGNATAQFLSARRIVICRDIRTSSEALAAAVGDGIRAAGCDVLDTGLGGTEMIYFSVPHLDADGGIMITASHNPAHYNGLKLVREQSKPISGDTGLADIRRLAEQDRRASAAERGKCETVDIFDDYVAHILGYVEVGRCKPLKLVVNAGNGGAGIVVDRLEPHLPFEFVKVHHEPDGSFPNGVPNPLLPENRAATTEAIRDSDADIGVAWDGDFDRCFLFDESGDFIEGYYIVGLLAESLLRAHPGERIVHDPRLTWNTLEIVESAGGEAVLSKSGHSFIKEKMREADALYGGEMSAHHYFRDFSYADSGMIPWLLVAELVSTSGKPLSGLVAERVARFPASGEINRHVEDAKATLQRVYGRYAGTASGVSDVDGYSFEFPEWRFNLRMSNTEPVVRLNVESRADPALMREKTAEVLSLIDS